MLIAQTHTHIQVVQVKGQQLRYTGHTVCFMQNVQKVYNKLSLLAGNLDVC